MRAVGHIIVIKRNKEGTQKTKGGLLLSENQRNDIRYHKGTVLGVGDEVAGLEIGDEIYFDKVAIHRIDIDGEKYYIIKDRDVVIVL